jgi:uncharacterized OB-fold protein
MREPSAMGMTEKTSRPLLCGDAVAFGADGRPVLVGGVCLDCGAVAFPRPPVCTGCMRENIAAERLPRQGTLYAFSVVHIAPKIWKTPMTVGYVDLAGGVRVFTHLQGGGFAIGDTVEVDIGAVGEDADGPIECFVFRRAKP